MLDQKLYLSSLIFFAIFCLFTKFKTKHKILFMLIFCCIRKLKHQKFNHYNFFWSMPGDSGNLTENEDETRLDDDIIPLENDLDLEN
ncbi:hypothetical protein BpHYR1_032341 [Brachionus plicatilis]|uniref:Uncharacterized protein n=1 Tax=Brachionus plicatilis TaxID=10195 RepID=A0A3M7QAS6_BRAPC|nr:hypothetical protein BpHYR1_032341 [Brachionus plicatilis]